MNYFVVLLAASLLGLNSALPYSLISHAQDVEVKEGEDVLFKCELEGTFRGMVLWMNDSNIISYGHDLAYPIPRVSLEGEGNAYNLRIQDVMLMDEGNWECQIPGRKTLRQVNTITIIIAPTITTTPDEGTISANEGDSLTLLCEADGKPEPTISWTKQGEDFKQPGAELSFGSITRDNAGTYTCRADNGVDDGDEATFDVDVTFPAEVEVGEELVYSGPGEQESLSCVFTSNPHSQVIWQLDNNDINVEEGGRLQVNNDESNEDELISTLVIVSVQAGDFGTYTCNGGNGKGAEVTGTIKLSGAPKDVTFESEPEGEYSDTYTLQWEFFSVADPIECALSLTDADGGSEGNNVVPSKCGTQHIHPQEYRITGLTVNTGYSATVNCKNEFGNTGVSEAFQFSTSEDENPAPLPTTTLKPEPEQSTTSPAPPTTLPHIPLEEQMTSETPLADIDIDNDVNAEELDIIIEEDNDGDKNKHGDEKKTEEKQDGSDDDLTSPSGNENVAGSASDVHSWSLGLLVMVAALFTFAQQ